MQALPVLIVGSGPTGLMMACELARHGIPFRLIDKNEKPTEGSNATWIQSRTLEIFDAVGIANDFLQVGHQCNAINFYDGENQIGNLPLTSLDSPYPYILMLPQRHTERLLIEHLKKFNQAVERSLELINVEQKNDEVICTLQDENGNVETVVTQWLIACDGANSRVREIM